MEIPESEKYLNEAGISVAIEIRDIGANHPNTYRITLSNANEIRRLTAISTGGGMIEVIEIDGAKVSNAGDFYVTLIYCQDPNEVAAIVGENAEFDEIVVHQGDLEFVEIKSQAFLDEAISNQLLALETVSFIKKLHPVLPIISRRNLQVPFITCEEMLDYNNGKDLQLWEIGSNLNQFQSILKKHSRIFAGKFLISNNHYL